MTARMRTALLAVVASIGLVSLAYGAGGMVGGGSSAASGGGSSSSAPAAPAGQVRMTDAADDPAPRPHRGPCHRHDQDGGGSSGSNSDSALPPDADSY